MQDTDSFDRADAIAIIGMAGRFPGARNLDEFWSNLKNGVESIAFFSDDEIEASGLDADLLKDSRLVKAAGVLDDVDLFAASFFGFSPREAEITDPQQRLFLECAWEALENAGYDAEKYQGFIGVYAGTSMNTYLLNLYSNAEIVNAIGPLQIGMANDKDFLSTRVSYKLNLKGPSLTVQTACSTSLVAVHLAAQSLLDGQCDMALAGGVSVTLPQKTGYLYQEGGIHSPDGHCRAFDANGGGFVKGNGVGVVILKRLEDAFEDRDNIYAIIRGSAINNDGSMKVGYTAPSELGQAEVIASALAIAGVGPETIGYIEAHGTATPIGDPIEIAALNRVFNANAKSRCAIGSVKTNIGHLDAAAGVASLIKTVLALQHKSLPPSLNFAEPNPRIDFAERFFVNDKLTEWNAAPRRAGISSFGIGGTNAHVVLEEAPFVEPSPAAKPLHLLVLSAKTETALEAATDNLMHYLVEHPESNLADVAYTLQLGRKEFAYRRAVTCRNAAEAVSALERLDPRLVVTAVREDSEPAVVFMFSGQGTQYVNMGRELYQLEPVFREHFDRCCAAFAPHVGLDLRSVIYPREEETGAASEQLKQTYITQPALFAIEYALAKMWMSWGIRPSALIGHSIGEFVAACLAGVFTVEEVTRVVAARGRLMQQMPRGSMLTVPLAEEELRRLLAGKDLSLAVVNGPANCVVAGPSEAVEEFERELSDRLISCRTLETSHAFHSTMMEPVVEPFIAEVRRAKLQPPSIPLISNVTGEWATDEVTEPAYWGRHLREAVKFSQGASVLLRGAHAFLEIGPGQSLSTLIRRQTGYSTQTVVASSLRHAQENGSDVAHYQKSLGQLWASGVSVNWQALYEGEQRGRVALPSYPFERERYWVEANWAGIFSTRAIATSERKSDLREKNAGNQPASIAMRTGHQRPRLKDAYVAPETESEQLIADLWCELLGLEAVGVHDNFFELGGDSILSLRITARANQLGLRLAPNDIFNHQTIAELATVAGASAVVHAEQGILTGDVPLTPIQKWFFEQQFVDQHHWNQAVLLELPTGGRADLIESVIKELLAHHDVLRSHFDQTDQGWLQHCDELKDNAPVTWVDLSGMTEIERLQAIESESAQAQSSLNLSTGPLLRVVGFSFEPENVNRLLIVIHHLLTDVVSWRVLLEDFVTAYGQLSQNQPVTLPAKTTSYQQWSKRLAELAESETIEADLPYWLEQSRKPAPRVPRDFANGANPVGDAEVVSVSLSEEETTGLLQEVPSVYQTQITDALLTALARALKKWTGERTMLVDVESHGREVIADDVDLSRTVGWFTSVFPLVIESTSNDVAETIKSVKEQLRRVPRNGFSYGLLRYLTADGIPENQSLQPEIGFLYLGQFDQELAASAPIRLAQEATGPAQSSKAQRSHLLDFEARVADGKLQITLTYNKQVHRRETANTVAEAFVEELRVLIAHCQSTQEISYTPSDFPDAELSQQELDELITSLTVS
ncbi:MAG TPA: condensation domain-containing protein [Pyrinomonadaceae bacterium]